MWFIGVEVEQETSAPPLEKNPGSAPEVTQAHKKRRANPVNVQRLDSAIHGINHFPEDKCLFHE